MTYLEFKNMPPHRQCPHHSARLSALAQSFTMASTSSKTQQPRSRALSKPSEKAPPVPKPPGRTACGWGKGRLRTQEVTGPLTAAKSSALRPPNIIWDETHVQELVSWLVTHPADRHILYHDRNQSKSAPSLPPDQQPSGRQKKNIHAAITKHIFDGKDSEYSNDPNRYATSVCNQLTAYVHTLQAFVLPNPS